MDEIVELSIRYGIITPYTSFLVEETERALREEGRQEIVQDVQATAAPAPASGEEAVDRSADEKALSEAEAPASRPRDWAAARPTHYGYEISPVKYVGDKTFVLHEGVWTDTTFDPDKMTPVPVSFGSDDYFALIAAHPEWGRYFALGEHVIVVLDGAAYEVRAGDAPPLDVPAVTPTADAGAPDAGAPGATPAPAEEAPDNWFDAVVQAIVGFFKKIADALTK